MIDTLVIDAISLALHDSPCLLHSILAGDSLRFSSQWNDPQLALPWQRFTCDAGEDGVREGAGGVRGDVGDPSYTAKIEFNLLKRGMPSWIDLDGRGPRIERDKARRICAGLYKGAYWYRWYRLGVTYKSGRTDPWLWRSSVSRLYNKE